MRYQQLSEIEYLKVVCFSVILFPQNTIITGLKLSRCQRIVHYLI
jgi:hypothetical protein